MPSWSDFLLPHPEPRRRAAPSSSSPHPHPQSKPIPSSAYMPAPPNSRVRHHLSAQGYLQPPPRSRYRPPPGSCSSSAQSSTHDLALRPVVSSSGYGHNHIQIQRPRADSAVITSASCTSFSCASARGRGSWQAVAEVFGVNGNGKENRKRDRKGKERERTPPPRIGALAFEVEEQNDEDEEAESDVETDWENVTLEEANGIGSDAESRKHDWGKVGLAISRRLLRSRSGDNLVRNGHWSGRGGGAGSEEGTSSRGVDMGVGRGRGKGTPGQLRDVSNSNAKQIAIGLNEKTDAVDHYGFGRGGISVGVGVGNRHDPTVGLEKRDSGKTPVISINGIELEDSVVGSLASLDGKSSSASGKVPTRTPEPSSQLPTFLSSNDISHSSLSFPSPSSPPSTSSSPALKAAEVAAVDINTWPRRHRPDRLKNACAIDDDIDLQCSVHSAAACLPSSSSRGADCSGEGPGNNENSQVVQEEEGSGGREAAVDGDAHSDVNRTVTGMHERGGKFQSAEPGDRIMDDNVGVGVGDAAVDDGDIDTVLPSDPFPLFDLSHNHHHHPHFLQQEEGSEDTPVVRSQPLPLTHSFPTTPPQSPPPDSPLRSAPSPRFLSPDFSQPALPPSNSSIQSLPFFSSPIHTEFPHPDLDSDMGLLNLMTRTPLVPSPDAAQTRVAHVGGGRSAATITWASTPPLVAVESPPPAVPVLHQAAVSAISVASQKSTKSSKLSKAAKKSKSSGSLDAFSPGSASCSDVTPNSQPPPSTMLLPPKLGTPYVVSPLAFDPATYFDSFASVSISAALSADSSANVLTGPSSSSSSTGVPTKPRALMQKASPAWRLRETVVEDDEEDSGSDSEDEAEPKQAVDMEPPIVPSISPPVLARTTLEVTEATTQLSIPPSPPPPLIRPSILSPAPSPQLESSMSTRSPPSFASVAPLSIAKKNPQSNQSGQKQKPGPTPAPASGVASLLARRFSFRSKSGGNLRGSYSSASSPGPGASRPSSPSPLRNESFERRVAEVVSMLESVSVSGSKSAAGGQLHLEPESTNSNIVAAPTSVSTSPSSCPSKVDPTSASLSLPSLPLAPSFSAASSSSTAPSAWTTQKLDLSQSPSNLPSLSASASSVDTDTFFEFGTGMSSSSGSGSPSLGSISTTPGTSPGPQLAAMTGPLSGSLARRWRKWSNNLGVWEREGQKEKQQDVGSSASANAKPGASTGPSSSTSTSQGQVQQELPGQSTIGEGGVRGAGGATSGSAESQSLKATQERLGEASSLTGKGTGYIIDDEASSTASASASLGASSTATIMPFTVPESLPTASAPPPTTRKLVKQRPNLRSASVDDQHHHDLQRIFSADDASAAASASLSSSRLRIKKPKFTLGGHSYGSSDTPDSPKASSFSTHGSAAGSSYAGTTGSTTTAANGLARRDTFRPPLIRRDAVATPEQATRRWTLASAITDEAISDEGLLKELERIRMVGEWDRRRARAVEREKGSGKSVDRRTRALSLDAQEEEDEGEADQTEEEDEVRLWEIDVGFEIWEGREGMLAREMERVRLAERQRLDREKEKADGDAASVSTGSSGHSSSSESVENSANTTPETTPSLSPLVMSPGFAAAASSSPKPASGTKSASPNSAANKTTSLVKQPAPTWLAAQRALLICRELILTERRYLGLMCLLLDTHAPPPSYAHQYQSNPHASMRTSASTSDIPSLQQHYRGIQQRLQYHSSAATATYASLPSTHSSSGSQQTHVLVGPAPPARMLAATMPLAETTARFLRAMEGAPSVGGVAKAFVDHEMEMEEVYVAWCREVGAWFADGSTAGSDSIGSANRGSSAMNKVPSPPGSMDGHTSHGHEDGSGDGGSSTIRLVPIPPPTPPLPGIPPFGGVASGIATSSSPTNPLKRVAGSWRRSITSIPSLVGGGSSNGGLYAANIYTHGSERRPEKECMWEREEEKESLAPMPMATAEGGETSPSSPTTALAAGFVFISGDRVLSSGGSAYANGGLSGLGSRSGSSSNAVANAGMETSPAKPLRKLAVRDLAILPTQRVMRYVLLYRDLLAHTPAAASSRVLVERALAVATRIAENCDRAQGHSAFVAPNAGSSPPFASFTNPATNPKNATPLPPAGSALESGTSSGANASRSGSGTSGSGNSSGSGWRRKGKMRSRTASLSAGPVPVLVSMTPVVRTSVAQKT